MVGGTFTLSPSLSFSLTGENYIMSLSSAEQRRERLEKERERELRRQGKVIPETLPPSCCYHVSLSGKLRNGVQKYYVNRLLGLILTGR